MDNPTLPAALEGDLRDLARTLCDEDRVRLEALIDRWSGIRPMRVAGGGATREDVRRAVEAQLAAIWDKVLANTSGPQLAPGESVEEFQRRVMGGWAERCQCTHNRRIDADGDVLRCSACGLPVDVGGSADGGAREG